MSGDLWLDSNPIGAVSIPGHVMWHLAGFLRVLRFHLPIVISSTLLSPGTRAIGPLR
jgi:hypothetical protein